MQSLDPVGVRFHTLELVTNSVLAASEYRVISPESSEFPAKSV